MVGTGEDVNAAGSSPPPALATTFLYELNICKRLSTWKVLNLGPIKCFILLKQHWTLIHFMFLASPNIQNIVSVSCYILHIHTLNTSQRMGKLAIYICCCLWLDDDIIINFHFEPWPGGWWLVCHPECWLAGASPPSSPPPIKLCPASSGSGRASAGCCWLTLWCFGTLSSASQQNLFQHFDETHNMPHRHSWLQPNLWGNIFPNSSFTFR